MNWTKLIQTMGRHNLYWDYVDEKMVLYNNNMLIYTPLRRLPPELVNIAKKGEASKFSAKCKQFPQHRCSFSGYTFERGRRIIQLYTGSDGEKTYPILIYRKYLELLGPDPNAIYASGSPKRPICYENRELYTAYIYPVRISQEDASRFSQLANLISEGAMCFV